MAKKSKKDDSLRKKRAAAYIVSRKVGTDEIHKRILVVGEGVNTVPSYFEKFKEPHVVVVPIGLGEGTRKLVNDVERYKADEERKLGTTFDEVWVAFDKDSFKDFEQAISEARAKGYNVAYSNQAVEYWFILHFMDHQGAGMNRGEYAKTLNDLLEKERIPIKYDPDAKEISDELFDVLDKRIQSAYDRADKIYTEKLNRNASTEESITTIHLLVKSIKGMTSTSEQRKLKEKEDSMRKAGLI